ncbi:MAG: CpaE family protein [Ahrensia sp.]|nr:CpaE family protein [Ahrensia sp.]
MIDVDPDTLRQVRPVPRITIQAFCETQGVAGPIERMADDRRLAKAQTRVYMGGLGAAVEFFQSAPTPNLILLETTLKPDELMRGLSDLAEVCDPSSRVVIIGHHNDVALYRELTRNGIAEYLVAPVSIADLMLVITNLFVDPDAEPLGKTIAFMGAKGGVGSSTLAHNVAWSISTIFQNEVVVADMDLPFGTANINFDQDPAQGIAEAVFSPDRIDETYLDRLLSTCAEHLSLLAAPSMLDKVYDFGPDDFTQLIDVAQRTAPCVVLDIPHVWNGWTRKTLARADEVVIVASPELANLRNTKNMIDTLKQLRPNDFVPKLILNQVGVPKRPEISVKDFLNSLGMDASAVIPFDPHLFGTAGNNGRMLAESDSGHPIIATISDLAHIVTGRGIVAAKPKGGLKSVLAKLKKK